MVGTSRCHSLQRDRYAVCLGRAIFVPLECPSTSSIYGLGPELGQDFVGVQVHDVGSIRHEASLYSPRGKARIGFNKAGLFVSSASGDYVEFSIYRGAEIACHVPWQLAGRVNVH